MEARERRWYKTHMQRKAIQSHSLFVLQWLSSTQDRIEAILLWKVLVQYHFLLVLQWSRCTQDKIEASLLWKDLI